MIPGKRSGLAVCIEVDVAVFRAGHFEESVANSMPCSLPLRGKGVDADDDLAALRLDALVQRVQVIQLLTQGLQPLNQKFTTVNALLANRLLSTSLPSDPFPETAGKAPSCSSSFI